MNAGLDALRDHFKPGKILDWQDVERQVVSCRSHKTPKREALCVLLVGVDFLPDSREPFKGSRESGRKSTPASNTHNASRLGVLCERHETIRRSTPCQSRILPGLK